MILVCIRPFGNFTPGDLVEVPAGAAFDAYYFEVKAEPAEAKSNSKPKSQEK